MWMTLSPITQKKIKPLRCEYSKMTAFPKLHVPISLPLLVSFISMPFLLAKKTLLYLYSEFQPLESLQGLCSISCYSLFSPIPHMFSLFISNWLFPLCVQRYLLWLFLIAKFWHCCLVNVFPYLVSLTPGLATCCLTTTTLFSVVSVF